MRKLRQFIWHSPFVILLGLISGPLLYLYFEPPYLRYEDLPWPVTLAKVRPGQVIPVRVRRCNDSKQVRAYTVTHQLVSVDSERRYVMEPRLTTIEPGCETTTSEINVIPAGTPPGMYRVVGAGIGDTLRSWAVPWHSQPFEVTQ